MVFLKEFFKNVDFEKNLKCHLLITSANNLDPDLADKKQNVGPDQDPNCSILRVSDGIPGRNFQKG